ncbi:MAG: alkaline phosphatase family protein [Calothrix sp. MO_192.B10]|nr:alkaline phosphatase family protein [Calothrix sp. MO_192.B10]
MDTSAENLQKIDHVVVIMLENRSFDHMLGFLYQDTNNVSPLGHPYEGLTGKEANPDSNGNMIRVFPIPDDQNPYFWPGADPGEGYFNTNEQLFGNHHTPPAGTTATNQGFIKNFGYTLGWQRKDNAKKPGSWPIVKGTTEHSIMGIFTPEQLPVLSTLAREFAVCDHWYSSVPTETMPNRGFVHMATSQGRLDDHDKIYTATTIFNRLEDAQIPWGIYGYTSPHLIRRSLQAIPEQPVHGKFGNFNDFKSDVEQGNLARYTFLCPAWGVHGNSQHPNYNVSQGEQFLLQIYQVLRHASIWEKVLLIITYDEHGGCYDHVSPPENAMEPKDCPEIHGFKFNRFGVRVPTILVSPWIEAGTVYRVQKSDFSANQDNQSTLTPFDHTSILATVEKRFGLTSLTARDAAAPHVGGVLTRTTPRTDDPLKGVKPPVSNNPPPYEENGMGHNNPSHLQQVSADMASRLPITDEQGNYVHSVVPTLTTADDMARYTHWRYNRYYHKDPRNYKDYEKNYYDHHRYEEHSNC